MLNLGSSTLADLGQDGVVLDVVAVIGLDLDGDTAQGALQGVLGGGVDHLGLKRANQRQRLPRQSESRVGIGMLTLIPASSGDQAMKVSLFLRGCQLECPLRIC